VFGKTVEDYSLDGSGAFVVAGQDGAIGHVPATGFTDLEVFYLVRPDLKLAIGANNLFDAHPLTMPLVSNGAGGVRAADGNSVYGEPLLISPFGINGGYYYGRLTLTF
jgi:iron complex outermembrane receptor protein